MEYRKLGNSGLSVSALGFGCMSMATNSLKENEWLIQEAVDAGINIFDTADLYERGHNEEVVGAALKPMRNRVILASKVGNVWRKDGSGWDWNPSKAHILKTAEESLRRLQTDRIDLYQLHGGTMEDPIDETIEAFEQLKKEGKILHYGISSIRPNVIREYVQRSNIVSVMMQYSLLDRRPEETALPLLEASQKGVLVRGALAQGLLLNKPAKDYLAHSVEAIAQAQEELKPLASNGKTTLQLALQYVLAHSAVSSVIAGIRTPVQLRSLLAAAAEPLDSSTLNALGTVIAAQFYTQHR